MDRAGRFTTVAETMDQAADRGSVHRLDVLASSSTSNPRTSSCFSPTTLSPSLSAWSMALTVAAPRDDIAGRSNLPDWVRVGAACHAPTACNHRISFATSHALRALGSDSWIPARAATLSRSGAHNDLGDSQPLTVQVSGLIVLCRMLDVLGRPALWSKDTYFIHLHHPSPRREPDRCVSS